MALERDTALQSVLRALVASHFKTLARNCHPKLLAGLWLEVSHKAKPAKLGEEFLGVPTFQTLASQARHACLPRLKNEFACNAPSFSMWEFPKIGVAFGGL